MLTETEMTRLVEVMRRTATVSLEVEEQEKRLLLVLPEVAATPNAAPPPALPVRRLVVKSPGMGRFLSCGADDGLEPPAPGAEVRAGQVLGYLACGAARRPICAPGDGRLGEALPEAGRLTGHGDPLFELEQDA